MPGILVVEDDENLNCGFFFFLFFFVFVFFFVFFVKKAK